MTPQELQLNDLVMVGNQVVKVTALSEYTINGQPATMFHEIPLTPEILEAYGFRESIEEGTYYFPTENESINDRGFALETFGDGVWFITDHILMQFKNFHELQHALRLCGLCEIADSIKLK